MAYDIRLSTNYLDHHKILKLRQICGSDAVLAHQRLLLYARENRPDGIFEGMDKDDLALIIRNEITNVNERYNAVETMLKLRLLDVNSEGDFCIHDWENHNKYSVDSAQKSDINRFCRLKAIAPAVYKNLKDEGVTSLTKQEYDNIKRTLTNVNESSNESLTPNPTQPNPTQPKNNIERKIKKEKKSESENDSPPDGSDLLSAEFQELWKIYSAKRIKTSIGSKARAYEQYRKQRKKFSFDTIGKHLKSYLNECNESGQFTKAAERWFRDAEFDEPIQQSDSPGLTQDFSEPDCMLFPPDTPEHRQRYHYAGKPDELYVCIGGEYHRVLNENGQDFYSKNGRKHTIGEEHATRNAS